MASRKQPMIAGVSKEASDFGLHQHYEFELLHRHHKQAPLFSGEQAELRHGALLCLRAGIPSLPALTAGMAVCTLLDRAAQQSSSPIVLQTL